MGNTHPSFQGGSAVWKAPTEADFEGVLPLLLFALLFAAILMVEVFLIFFLFSSSFFTTTWSPAPRLLLAVTAGNSLAGGKIEEGGGREEGGALDLDRFVHWSSDTFGGTDGNGDGGEAGNDGNLLLWLALSLAEDFFTAACGFKGRD